MHQKPSQERFIRKPHTLTIKYTFFLCTIILFSLNGCSVEDDEMPNNLEPISIDADNNQYAPYEIVTITSPENIFTAKSFPAKLNDIEIIVGSSENIASFVLPNLANGDYNLSFILNEKPYIVPITVSSLSNLLSADEYFNEIQTNLTQNISELNSQIIQLEENSTDPNEYTDLRDDVTQYTRLLTEYTTSYNNLSSEEKQEFAKSMAVNKPKIDELNNLNADLNTSIATLRTQQTVEDYEKGVEVSKGAYLLSIAFTVAHIPAMIATSKVIANPNPYLSVGALLATGLIFTNYCINLNKTANQGKNLTEKSLKPFEFISQTSQTVYDSGIETVSNIQAKYRSLINSDTNNGSTISAIVENYNYLKDKYNNFRSEIPSIIRPKYVITSLRATYNSTRRSVYNKYISITQASNSNVTLQQLNQADGSVKIKATNLTDTDQSFTYEVKYTNSNFTTGLTKSVSAKVMALVDSIPIYTASAIGKYTVDYPYVGRDGSNVELYVELKEDGLAKYTIYNSGSWPDGHYWHQGWFVTKVDNQYYILTSWTNPGYLQKEAEPLTYPVTSFVYRHLYSK